MFPIRLRKGGIMFLFVDLLMAMLSSSVDEQPVIIIMD